MPTWQAPWPTPIRVSKSGYTEPQCNPSKLIPRNTGAIDGAIRCLCIEILWAKNVTSIQWHCGWGELLQGFIARKAAEITPASDEAVGVKKARREAYILGHLQSGLGGQSINIVRAMLSSRCTTTIGHEENEYSGTGEYSVLSRKMHEWKMSM